MPSAGRTRFIAVGIYIRELNRRLVKKTWRRLGKSRNIGGGGSHAMTFGYTEHFVPGVGSRFVEVRGHMLKRRVDIFRRCCGCLKVVEPVLLCEGLPFL